MSRWRQRHHRDANWYRVKYSLAAQRLHAAAQRDRGGEGYLTAAERDAQDLFLTSLRVLRQGHWNWPRRTPGRIRRRVLARGPARNERLARFLDGTVEPTAAVVLASAYVEQGELRARHYTEAESSRPTRRRLLRRAEGGRRGLMRRRVPGAPRDTVAWYLRALSASSIADLSRPWWQRVLGWLGVARFQRPRTVSYRTHYTMACFYSRLAARESDDSLWHEAAIHFLLAFQRASLENGERLALWARRDPALRAFRKHRSDVFTAAVSGYERPKRVGRRERPKHYGRHAPPEGAA